MADDAPGGSPDQAGRSPAAAPDDASGAPFGPDAADAPTTPFDPAPSAEPPTTPFDRVPSAEPPSSFDRNPAAEPTTTSFDPNPPAEPTTTPFDPAGAPEPATERFGGPFTAPAPSPPVTDPIIVPPADVVPPSGEQVAKPARKSRIPRWLPLAGVIAFIAACAVTMLLILGFSYGASALAIGLGAAILPVPVLVACFLWLDRYEPEPTKYLLFCFAWGSSVATLAALGVNSLASVVFDKLGLPDALVAVLVAPFIEESMKAAGPILLLWRRRREWSGITDGIVYCGLSAIGFAMVENVLYLGGHGYAAGADQYGPATGIQNVFLIFIVRILFTGFAHPLFTSMTGVGLGVSARSADRRVIWLAPIAGLLTAMILHGTFNLLPTLSAATGQPLIMLYGYLGFMVPFFFAAVGFAIALRGWEGRLSERVLPHYVRTGWFSPPEVAALGSLGRRHSARRWAKRVSGDAGVKAMRGFQFAATQLALLRDGMQRGLNRKPQDVQRATEDEQRLLTAIVGYRSVFAGRDPQMPRAFWDGRSYQIAFPDGVTRSVDAPAEPVVPVPVRMAPQMAGAWSGGYGAPPPGYGQPSGYGQRPGYGQPGYGPPGYRPPGYGPPGYGPPGYGPPGYGPPGYGPPGYGPPGYGPPGYGQPPGYGGQPGFGYPGSSYGPGAAGYGGNADYGAGYGGGPGYGASGYGTPGHPAQGISATEPGDPGFGPPGHGMPTSGSAPGYGAPTSGSAPGYGPPTSGSAPGYGAASSPAHGYGPPASGYPAPPPGSSYGAPSSYGAYPPPGYSTAPAHSTPPAGAQPPGNYGAAPPASQEHPASGGRPGYGGAPGYGAGPGNGGAPGYGAGPGYGGQPTQSSAHGFGDQPSQGNAPGYGGQPHYGGRPNDTGQTDHVGQPGYGGDPGQGGEPGNEGQLGHGTQPGHETQPGNETQPGGGT